MSILALGLFAAFPNHMYGIPFLGRIKRKSGYHAQRYNVKNSLIMAMHVSTKELREGASRWS